MLLSDPKHIDDFKVHFRLSRDLYIVIPNEVFVVLQRNDHGPQATVLPDKQLLVALWYLYEGGCASLWFINCNGTRDNKGVYKTIGKLSKKVVFSHENSLLNCVSEVHI